MSLKDKYKELIDATNSSGVSNVQVKEQDNVLYIEGDSPSGEVKDKLWSIYNKIDPDFRTGDLVLDINVSTPVGSKAIVATESTNLNVRKGPGTDQPIIGKAAHNDEVTILSKANDQWSLIKTKDGVEGYVYNQYLSPVK